MNRINNGGSAVMLSTGVLVAMLAAVGLLFSSPAARAQATRPINVWVDTIRMNVCQDNSQFNIPIRIDRIYGQDSVYGIAVIVEWDKSTFDIDTRILSSGTLAAQAPDQTVQKDPSGEGLMYIELANASLNGVISGPGPLMYLIGRVTAPDTVDHPYGWITVTSIQFESNTQFEPSFSPGYVRVVRDTTAGFTGRLVASDADLDTLETDTVTISAENLRGKRVRRIAFSVVADTSYFAFIDTLESGTLAGAEGIFSSKQVSLSADSINVVLTAGEDLQQDGALLRLVVRRRTDSAFARPLAISGFGVNTGSCLGRLLLSDGTVAAEAIIEDDTSTVGIVADRLENASLRLIHQPEARTIRLTGGNWAQVPELGVYDLLGRRHQIERVEKIGTGVLVVTVSGRMPAGSYFLVLRDGGKIVCKQFKVI